MRRNQTNPTNRRTRLVRSFLRVKVGDGNWFYGFFFLNKPVMASTGLSGLGLCCALVPAVLAPPPPKQPSLDLNMSAAMPPTSGTNLGSAVVPLTWKGTVKPLLQSPPATFPRIPPSPPPTPPPLLAADCELESVATILKSKSFLESTVPAPVMLPSCVMT